MMIWLRNLWDTFRSIHIPDVLDILIISLLLYFVLLWFKRTKAAFVARGILIFALIYIIARQAGMYLTTWMFQGFFAIFLIALVVIFQEELRSFFERIAIWSLQRRRTHPLQPREVEEVVRVAGELARRKIGALIVLRGRDPLERHIEGGEDLDGQLSSPLLESLFDPHSEGHDGAVIIAGDRVSRFGAHLPLSKEFKKLAHVGTRHAAALGLSERTDAMCLVVSEERGVISLARDGSIAPVSNLEELEERVAGYLREKAPVKVQVRWRDLLRKNAAEKLIAVGISLALWLVLVRGYSPSSEVFKVPVEVRALSATMRVSAIRPARVNVTLKGLQRDLKLLNPLSLRLFIPVEGLAAGSHRITLSEELLRFPGALQVDEFDPSTVELSLMQTNESDKSESSKSLLRLLGLDSSKKPASAHAHPEEAASP